MVKAENIRCGYFGKEVLKGVSLEAKKGSITAILGPNGCGKTTFLKSLCGMVPLMSGRVLLDGQDISPLTGKQISQKVSYLAQGGRVPDITVGRLVLHGRFPYLNYPRRYREEDRKIAKKALETVGISDLAEKKLDALSGGQRQKAYIAMALSQDTDVILFDEPTTYLDVSFQLRFLRQVKAIAEGGKCVIMAIHDLSHALETADRVLVLKDGTKAGYGTPEEVYNLRVLDEVFGIKVERLSDGGKARYFVREK